MNKFKRVAESLVFLIVILSIPSVAESNTIIPQASSNSSAVPSAPQSLQATGGNAKVTLSWQVPSSNGGSAITNYKIYKSTSSGTEVYFTTRGNVTSYTDLAVTNGNTYFYQVTALNSVGESPRSNEASATLSAPPSAPQSLLATGGNAKVTLSWQVPSSNGGSAMTSYKIYKSTSSGTEVYFTTRGNVTSYTDLAVTNGNTYFYQVTALNSVGESPRSNEASATLSAPPSAPQSLQATGGNAKVTLSWQVPSSNGGSAITNYKIYKSTSSGTEVYFTTRGNVTSYTDLAVTNGITYFYQISALNSADESPRSNEASATPPIMPSAPQNLQATGGNARVTLSWQVPSSNGGSAITSYKIYKSTSSGTEVYLTTRGNVTSYTDLAVTNGNTYFYQVTALNSVGESPRSNEASATPGTTATQAISLNPSTGPRGTTVTVTGTNFSHNSAITAVTYDGTTVITTPAIITTNSTGGFSATFAVPSSTAGLHTVSAQDASSNSASAQFTVTTSSISLNPTSGPTGTTINISGNNFVANSVIAISYDGSPIATNPGTITANSTGGFTGSIIVPSSIAGLHTVSAQDASSNSASAQFTVTTSSISINPTKKNTGTTITI